MRMRTDFADFVAALPRGVLAASFRDDRQWRINIYQLAVQVLCQCGVWKLLSFVKSMVRWHIMDRKLLDPSKRAPRPLERHVSSYAGMCIASIITIAVDKLWSVEICRFLYLALWCARNRDRWQRHSGAQCPSFVCLVTHKSPLLYTHTTTTCAHLFLFFPCPSFTKPITYPESVTACGYDTRVLSPQPKQLPPS